jgi:hypothetical protein
MKKIRIRYPGWKNSDPGSGINIPDPGINIPDPQHCLFLFDYRTPYRDLFMFTVRLHILGPVILVWTWVKPLRAYLSRVLPKSQKAFVWFFGVPFFVVVSKYQYMINNKYNSKQTLSVINRSFAFLFSTANFLTLPAISVGTFQP